MFGEFKFDLSGTNAILLLVIVGATLVLFYMEIRKLKVQIQGILKRIEIISGEPKEPNLGMKQIPEKLTMDEISGSFIPMNEELNNYPISNDRVNIPQENISQENISGIVHLVGDKKISMYELAKLTTPEIQPMTMNDYVGPQLTVDMSLDTNRWKKYKINF